MRGRTFNAILFAVVVSRQLPSVTCECSLLLYADGLGTRHATLGGIPSDPDAWFSGRVATPAGDSATVVSMLSTGCAHPMIGSVSMSSDGARVKKLWEYHSKRGLAHGLVTSKCADDGSSSGFLVSSKDRYDLTSVASAITSLRPAPFMVSGGFSHSLWRSAVANSSSYVEFDSEASSAYSELCEYPSRASFPERCSEGLSRGLEAGGKRGFFLSVMYAGVDMAAHSGSSEDVDDALAVLRRTIDESVGFLSKSCPKDWRMVVVGSHATGGNGTHRHHSEAGTPVPFYARGFSSGRLSAVESMMDVGRLFAPSLSCVKSTSRHQVFHYRDARDHEPLSMVESVTNLTLFFILLFLLPYALFSACCEGYMV